MIRSRQVLEWQAEGKAEGQIESKIEDIMRLLKLRFEALPQELEDAVRATTDLDVLRHQIDTAATAGSLADFRQITRV